MEAPSGRLFSELLAGSRALALTPRKSALPSGFLGIGIASPQHSDAPHCVVCAPLAPPSRRHSVG